MAGHAGQVDRGGASPDDLALYQCAIIAPAIIAPVVVKDPTDDAVLACALAAQADLVVSGDTELLDLKIYRGIPIVKAAEALERIARR